MPPVSIPLSDSFSMMTIPSLSSPTQQWRSICRPKEFSPIAMWAAAPGVSSELSILRTGTGAVESRLLA